MKKIAPILAGLCLSLCLFSAAILAASSFTPLYRLFVPKLELENPIPEESILTNYDRMVDYNLSFGSRRLVLDHLAMSEHGAIHFEEVRRIFQAILLFFFISAAMSLLLSGMVKKKALMLKTASLLCILLPALLTLPLLFGFERAFIGFHKLFFQNDYWIFDPATDPIILYLPASFFLAEALLILGILIFFALIFFFLARKAEKKEKRLPSSLRDL